MVRYSIISQGTIHIQAPYTIHMGQFILPDPPTGMFLEMRENRHSQKFHRVTRAGAVRQPTMSYDPNQQNKTLVRTDVDGGGSSNLS